MMERTLPNIIITGTPGCGKTKHSKKLLKFLKKKYKKKHFKFEHICVSEFAKKNGCIDGYDEVLESLIVDEDKLLKKILKILKKGGIILDWHCCEIFPEDLIDLVIVLRTDNSILHDRLLERGYKDNKIQENLDCEIMDLLIQEAMESFDPQKVIEFKSNILSDLKCNVKKIYKISKKWINNINAMSL